jgi:hypothetical protein
LSLSVGMEHRFFICFNIITASTVYKVQQELYHFVETYRGMAKKRKYQRLAQGNNFEYNLYVYN